MPNEKMVKVKTTTTTVKIIPFCPINSQILASRPPFRTLQPGYPPSPVYAPFQHHFTNRSHRSPPSLNANIGIVMRDGSEVIVRTCTPVEVTLDRKPKPQEQTEEFTASVASRPILVAFSCPQKFKGYSIGSSINNSSINVVLNIRPDDVLYPFPYPGALVQQCAMCLAVRENGHRTHYRLYRVCIHHTLTNARNEESRFASLEIIIEIYQECEKRRLARRRGGRVILIGVSDGINPRRWPCTI